MAVDAADHCRGGDGYLSQPCEALTQIQEQTLSFAIKLVAVTLTLLLTARWVGGEIYNYAMAIFENFPTMVP